MNEIEFLMYEADEKIEVIVKDETIWATQKTIAGLFDVGVPAISKHLKNIKDVKYYNLDAFNKHQIIDSDFDKEIRKIQGGNNER